MGLPRKIHYGWFIVPIGTMTVFVALGLGRFALGMLLPSMGVSLDLSYDEMGYISTGNFIGYLLAVLMAGALVRRMGARKAIALGLFLVGASMLLVGRADGFVAVLILYVLTGAGSAAANVPIMGLVSHWFARHVRGRAAGFMVIGSGFAIMFAGLTIPFLNQTYGAEGWRIGWTLLGAISLAGAMLAYAVLRNHPEDLGIQPVGGEPPPLPPGHVPQAKTNAKRFLLHLGAIYFLYGATYAVFATFMVTTLVRDFGFSEAEAGRFWIWVGGLSLLSGPLFGSLSDRLGRKVGLMLPYTMHMTAYALVAMHPDAWGIYLAIALFGGSAWAVPGIMAVVVGDVLGPALAVKGFGTITVIFGMGQIAGPALAGIIAEANGSFGVAYWMISGLAGLAILLTAVLKFPSASEQG
ncbi:MAG: YbfB/YjiJ family MFS transporter [Alphaproteobacteria bacterium]|nr:YbfB/YjiJ family MFS transporter [Alphaproteobacteria bacterium]